MTAFPRYVARLADRLVAASQFAGQRMGAIPPHREQVSLSVESDRLTVMLPDRSEQGWPAVSTPIPMDFHLSGSTISLLTRTASFVSDLALEDLPDAFASASVEVPEGSREWSIGSGASVRIGLVAGVCTLVIRQVRAFEALESSMRRAMNEGR